MNQSNNEEVRSVVSTVVQLQHDVCLFFANEMRIDWDESGKR
jgi:hypothetical protein